MSVEVKTPTKTQFEHAEFPCGDKKRGNSVSAMPDSGGPAPVSVVAARPVFNRQTSENLGVKYGRKRRYSERAGGDQGGSRERYPGAPGASKRRFSRSGRGGPPEKIVLPTKFLLGGNINDPLNLNSLSDESVNKALNENTPKSSPIEVPYHRRHVHVILPPNIEDPLGLDIGGEDPALLSPRSMGKNRKKRNKHKKKNQGDKSEMTDVSELTNISNMSETKDFTTPVHVEIFSDSELLSNTSQLTPVGGGGAGGGGGSGGGGAGVVGTETSTPIIPPSTLKLDLSGGSTTNNYPPEEKVVVDHIVSPVIPQLTSPKSRRRKRTSSECKSDGTLPRLSLWDDDEKGTKATKPIKTSPHRSKFKRQQSHSSNQSQPTTPTTKPKPKHHGGRQKRDKVFIYGNYNQYYGYRNPDGGSDKDNRLKNFQQGWFEGKDVLDIGCNAGHVTLAIAKNFNPKRITGIDIDSHLVGMAKKNIRHYLTSKVTRREKYPSSLMASFGPIAAPPVKMNSENTEFPNNVFFTTANYVLESDELVDMAREEYDVILALSVTKWMHLNWGDAGLKRTFRRIYRQLRPGGKLILEPQLWPSYKKRKKLTEAHCKNYGEIQLRPEQFREYLLREVGFSKSEVLEVPYNKAKGFQRPLLVFTKSSTTQPCSRVTTPGRSDTSRGATPRFQVGWSGTTTPNTCDSYDSSNRYAFSPACLTKDAPKGDQTPKGGQTPKDATPNHTETPSQTLVKGETVRPFGELRSQSAPAILGTDHSKVPTEKNQDDTKPKNLETSVLNTGISRQGNCPDSTKDTVEKVEGDIKDSLDKDGVNTEKVGESTVEQSSRDSLEKGEGVRETSEGIRRIRTEGASNAEMDKSPPRKKMKEDDSSTETVDTANSSEKTGDIGCTGKSNSPSTEGALPLTEKNSQPDASSAQQNKDNAQDGP